MFAANCKAQLSTFINFSASFHIGQPPPRPSHPVPCVGSLFAAGTTFATASRSWLLLACQGAACPCRAESLFSTCLRKPTAP